MKNLGLLFASLPGAAFAHGGHVPMPEATHGLAHLGPWLGAVAIAAAIGLAVIQRWRA